MGLIMSEGQRGKYYWAKTSLNAKPDEWNIIYIDKSGMFWLFSVQATWPLSEIDQLGPEIVRPDEQDIQS